MASFLDGLSPSSVLALGPVPVSGKDVTFTPDKTKGRSGDTTFIVPRPFTIRAEKCPNRRGVEAVLSHFRGSVVGFDELNRRIASGEFKALYVASDAIDPWINEPEAQALRKGVEYLVVQDTNVTPLAQLADAVLAGATFAEKAGCYVNADGRLQYAEAALPPRDGALPDLDLFTILLGRGAGPVRSRDVLKEVAEAVPAFAVAEEGKVPAFGATLEEPATVGAGAVAFNDPWMQPRFLKGDRPGEASPKGGRNA
jgi:NADH-quinone oxidoreductase subunit G